MSEMTEAPTQRLDLEVEVVLNRYTNTETGLKLPAWVTSDGMFHATVDGQDLEAETLDRLNRIVRDTVVAAKVEVPFVALSGIRGTIRGYHGGNYDLLVTYEDGHKDRLRGHAKMFRPGDVTDAELAELKALRATVRETQAEIAKIEAKCVDAGVLLNEALGEELV
jgi:hypothetical protein